MTCLALLSAGISSILAIVPADVDTHDAEAVDAWSLYAAELSLEYVANRFRLVLRRPTP